MIVELFNFNSGFRRDMDDNIHPLGLLLNVDKKQKVSRLGDLLKVTG